MRIKYLILSLIRLEIDKMNTLQRMRQAIREQRYRVSSHANEEMAKDFLVAADIENIILTGKIITKFTRDPRGIRYEVYGDTIDYRRGSVICRFLLSGILLIITAYVETKIKGINHEKR
jgi:hypothetical protein